MTKTDTVSFTLRAVPADIWRKLRHLALEENQSMQEFLQELLAQAAAKGQV